MIQPQALLVLQLVLFQNVQRTPGIEFVSPLHQVEPFYLCHAYEHSKRKHICKQFLIGQFGDTALPCTDDSDCISLGWKYGCFLYR